MAAVETIWWLLFWTAVGLCLGSFLNVVIYRLPRGQSIRDPLWSVCPACGNRIRWYDNLPVLSFVLLRGRCRSCQAPISVRYPIVELLTALVVIALFDAFFIAQTRTGLFPYPHLTWALSQDWPIFLAHVVLFACLLAMAAIDLREYWLDVRFTTVATVCGFGLHALWTPPHSGHWVRPHDATAIGAFGAIVGLSVMWLWLRTRPVEAWHHLPGPSDVIHPHGLPTDEWRRPWSPIVAQAAEAVELAGSRFASLAGAIAVGVVLTGILVASATDKGERLGPQAVAWRTLVPVVVVFVLILAELRVPRPADQEIIHAIEAERHSARRMVLGELVWLLPAIALGLAGVWLCLSDGAAADRLSGLLHWRVAQSWEPVYGLATAATGYCLGGAMGWLVRIVFTLVLGREAFGLGDIHMMAAAGCVAGWPVVVLGFFLTVFLALLALGLTLPFKRTRAIALVPWLALGYLVTVVHYDRLLTFGPVRNAIELVDMLVLQNSQSSLPGAPL